MDVSLIVPFATAWFGYKWGLRKDERQWTRERRAELYIDLLVEVGAGQAWLEWRLVRAVMDSIESSSRPVPFTGHPMLSPGDRARLGARAYGIASEEVRLRWSDFSGTTNQAVLDLMTRDAREFPEHYATITRVRVGAAHDALVRRIRHELRADQLRFGEATRWLGWCYKLGRRSD